MSATVIQAIPHLRPGAASREFAGMNPILQRLGQEQGERVQRALARLKSGDLEVLDPLRRQERWQRRRSIASALREVLPEREMQRRLRLLGFRGRWTRGRLDFVDLDGAGVNVVRGLEGEMHTGPAVDRLILVAFPELLPLTLRSMPVDFEPTGASNVEFDVSDPNTTASRLQAWNLSGVDESWWITNAVGRYIVGIPFLGPNCTVNDVTVTDPFGSVNVGTLSGPSDNKTAWTTWSAAGRSWVHKHAGEPDDSPGNRTLSFTTSSSQWDVELTTFDLKVTYAVDSACLNRPGYLPLGDCDADACAPDLAPAQACPAAACPTGTCPDANCVAGNVG